jgi:hypothetical protein
VSSAFLSRDETDPSGRRTVPILSLNLDFGGVAITLTEGINLDRDGGI